MFANRIDTGIEKHSGFIGIDIDDVEDPAVMKSMLCCDEYVVAAFTSISGRGLCVVFNIHPPKHREAFQGISEYLYQRYQVICDPTSINVSRPRFVSYDPDIYTTANYKKFVQYPKEKPPKKIEKVIYASNDFEHILNEIHSKRINLCENYHDWLRIGFAIGHKFGESGRQYFHCVSQYSSKYNPTSTDKQYTACLKHYSSTEATIATFYYYVKNAGIQIYSERTKAIAYTAAHGKKGGLSEEQVCSNLEKFEDITGAEDLVHQVYTGNIEINEDSIISELEMFLRQGYSLRRNEITRFIENKNKQIEQKDFNTIFIAAKKVMEKISYELVDRLINSDFVPNYNPFLDFINENKEINTTGNIEKIFRSINSKDPEYVLHFGRKWLVGMIASIHGQHSPLMLVLTGEKQNTGKTEWFRRLLPSELGKYYAESKLDEGKDGEILMTQKLLVVDDEMGGKSKKESKRLKELTSKQVFTLREPYGRNNVDLVRIATLGGTSNDNELLNDPTGNRRIVPVETYRIDHELYNSVNKVELFMEAYWLWKSDFKWKLGSDDISYLNVDKISFEVSNFEKELIQKYFTPSEEFEQMTSSEILIYLESKTRQRITVEKIGKELKALGFVQKKLDSGTRRVYCLKKNIEEALPF